MSGDWICAIERPLIVCFFQAINYANNQSRAKTLLEELEKIPSTTASQESPRFETIQADVGDRASIQELVRHTVTKFGRIDVVVSNAGWTRITDFANLEEGMIEDDWDRCFLYNVKSHLWLIHAAKAELEKTEGAFVTTASIAGVKPSGSSLPYAVTKAAAIHLSKSLAVICAPKIRVNSVSPGLLLTEWGMKFPAEKREAMANATKLKRLATIDVYLHLFSPVSWLLTHPSGRGSHGQNSCAESVDDRTKHGSRQWIIFIVHSNKGAQSPGLPCILGSDDTCSFPIY